MTTFPIAFRSKPGAALTRLAPASSVDDARQQVVAGGNLAVLSAQLNTWNELASPTVLIVGSSYCVIGKKSARKSVGSGIVKGVLKSGFVKKLENRKYYWPLAPSIEERHSLAVSQSRDQIVWLSCEALLESIQATSNPIVQGMVARQVHTSVPSVIGSEWVDAAHVAGTEESPIGVFSDQYPFAVSTELAGLVLRNQAGGSAVQVSAEELTSVRQLIAERSVEAVADFGYRLRRFGRSSETLARISKAGALQFYNNEFASMLVRDLNLAVLESAEVVRMIFVELSSWLTTHRVQGAWGSLQFDGESLDLTIAQRASRPQSGRFI